VAYRQPCLSPDHSNADVRNDGRSVMLKDWIEVANPVSPLANRLFPNPYVHISFEDDWRRYLATYSLRSRWEIPLDVTLRGAKLAGFSDRYSCSLPSPFLLYGCAKGPAIVRCAGFEQAISPTLERVF